MSADPAGRANPLVVANPNTPVPDLGPAKVNEPMEAAHVTKGHHRPILTSPHTVTRSTDVNAEGRISATRSNAPMRKEVDVSSEASSERVVKSSTPEPHVVHGSPSDACDSAPGAASEVSGGSMSDSDSESSDYAALYGSSRRETATSEEPTLPTIQTSVATPSKTSRIPRIQVQHPTRDPSESEEVVPQCPLAPEAAQAFVKSPLRRISVTPDMTTAAPDTPAAGSDTPAMMHNVITFPATPDSVEPAPQALPNDMPAGLSHLLPPSKSRLLLRRARNRTVTMPVLQLVLGRSVAEVAKPALHRAAHPAEAMIALYEADPMSF